MMPIFAVKDAVMTGRVQTAQRVRCLLVHYCQMSSHVSRFSGLLSWLREWKLHIARRVLLQSWMGWQQLLHSFVPLIDVERMTHGLL